MDPHTLAEKKRAFDIPGMCPLCLKTENAKLKKEKQICAFWFGRFGRHDPTCNKQKDNICTCGLAQARKDCKNLEE